jgi:hypothetical protein
VRPAGLCVFLLLLDNTVCVALPFYAPLLPPVATAGFVNAFQLGAFMEKQLTIRGGQTPVQVGAAACRNWAFHCNLFCCAGSFEHYCCRISSKMCS